MRDPLQLDRPARTPWGTLPSPWADEYHNAPFDEILGGGSAGPGKTGVLIEDPFPQIFVEHARCLYKGDQLEENLSQLGIPTEWTPRDGDLTRSRDCHIRWGESRGWALHLRRTLKMLKQSIKRAHEIFPKIDPDVKWDDGDSTFVFKSGFHFQFGHCQHANSWQDHMGIEYTHLGYDELVQFDEEQKDQIDTRLRTPDPVLMLLLRNVSMTNPTMVMDAEDTFAVKDAYWVRRRFVDPAPEGRKVLEFDMEMDDGTVETETRFFLPATIDDNPDKAFVRKYKIRLMRRPLHIREALLKGNWYFTPGSYYGEVWNQRLHVIAPHRIPPDWPVFRSMDWGYKHHGCIHWWTMDPDGNLICIRELFFIGKTDIEVAKMVKEIEQRLGLWRGDRSAITGPADTQLWEQRGAHTQSMAANFAKKGVFWLKCDKGKTMQRSAELLLGRLGDHKNGITIPGIQFFASCPQAIRAIPSIMHDSDKPWLPRDGGEFSHAHDSVRYACQYASRGIKGLGRPPKTKSIWDEEEKAPKAAKTGTYFGYG